MNAAFSSNMFETVGRSNVSFIVNKILTRGILNVLAPRTESKIKLKA